MFHEILVVDYITDYQKLTQAELNSINVNLLNPQFLTNCPSGTIIGIPIDGNSNNQKKVYYPVLSHINLPIKSGERAWAFDQNMFLVSYWISRKVQNTSAEDLNFTHDDRARLYPGLLNNPNGRKINTSQFYDANMSAVSLKKVRTNSLSRKKEFIGEPTPTVASKSTDLTLQGSNGTVINFSNRGVQKSATIEISAGFATEDKNLEILKNVENYDEVIKPSPTIDLSTEDASKITISQLFNPDSYYSLPGDDTGEQPSIAIKTDVVRILSKDNLKIVAGPSNAQSTIHIKSDGNIVISPSNLIKLSGEADNQPYIRYDEFNRIIDNLGQSIITLQNGLVAISALLDQVINGTLPVPVPTIPPAPPPIPATSIVTTTVVPGIAACQSVIESSMLTVGSKKILGT